MVDEINAFFSMEEDIFPKASIPMLTRADSRLPDDKRKHYECEVASAILAFHKDFDGDLEGRDLYVKLNCAKTLYDRVMNAIHAYLDHSGDCKTEILDNEEFYKILKKYKDKMNC